jgi:hypothetical protein
MATETQMPIRQRKPKRRRAHIQLFIDPLLYRQFEKRARLEFMSLSGWLREAGKRELRRKPAA